MGKFVERKLGSNDHTCRVSIDTGADALPPTCIQSSRADHNSRHHVSTAHLAGTDRGGVSALPMAYMVAAQQVQQRQHARGTLGLCLLCGLTFTVLASAAGTCKTSQSAGLAVRAVADRTGQLPNALPPWKSPSTTLPAVLTRPVRLCRCSADLEWVCIPSSV